MFFKRALDDLDVALQDPSLAAATLSKLATSPDPAIQVPMPSAEWACQMTWCCKQRRWMNSG
jgi:hypothetical protein